MRDVASNVSTKRLRDPHVHLYFTQSFIFALREGNRRVTIRSTSLFMLGRAEPSATSKSLAIKESLCVPSHRMNKTKRSGA